MRATPGTKVKSCHLVTADEPTPRPCDTYSTHRWYTTSNAIPPDLLTDGTLPLEALILVVFRSDPIWAVSFVPQYFSSAMDRNNC